MKRAVSILIFLCIGLNWSTANVYLFGCVIILISLLYIRRLINIDNIVKEDFLILSMLCVWLYGIILGFLRKNNVNFIIANFAGMSLYITYYSFRLLNIKTVTIIKILKIAGFSVCLISFLRIFRFLFGLDYGLLNILISDDVGISSTGQFRIYFTTMCTAYGLMGISLYKVIFHRDITIPNKKPNICTSLLCLILTIITLAFLSASKGFMLGVIVLLITIPLLCSQKSLKQYRINKKLFSLGLLLIIFTTCLFISDYFNIILSMFDSEDIANADRYEQLSYIIKDLNLLGNGLGATVPGSIRNIEKPYGFELTYLNIFHKFGIFAFIILYNYYYIIRKSIKLFRNNGTMGYGVIAISCMGYLIPSIGNPLLFDPSMIILNCIVLYIISKLKVK